MFDLQVLSLLSMAQVDSFEEIADSSPRALRVRGRGFLSAQDVVLNGMVNNHFTLVSRSEMIVVVPYALRDVTTTALSVDVLLAEATPGERMYVRFGMTRSPRLVSGPQKLVQTFLVQLLSDSGSCAFDRSAGTPFRSGLSGDVSDAQKDRLTAVVSQSVQAVQTYLTRVQNGTSLPAAERLLAAALERLDYVNGVPMATIRISTYAGQAVYLPITL